MRKQLLLNSMLLLCALIVGSTSLWAEEETITLSKQGYTNAQGVSSTSGSVVKLEYTDGGTATAYYTAGTGVRVYAGGSITITANGNTITNVSVTHTKEKSAAIEWSSNGTETSNSTGTPATWEGSATSVVLNVKTRGHIRMQSVTVTYTVASKTDPTIEFSDGDVHVGKTLDLSTLFESNSTGAVTYSITEGDSYASIDGNVLTGTAEGIVTVKAEQEEAGSYNAGEATATIYVLEALTLSSIAITTEPTTTTYDEGQIFDATGMVVTATYSDNSTDDVTALCTWTPNGALSVSDTEITVSYTENGVTRTAIQNITVNEYVQPTSVTIQMTNSLFGEEVHTIGKSTEELTFVGKQHNVTVTYYVPSDSYYYFNTSNTRPYNTCTLTYGAPTDYVITKIVFTSDGNNWYTATPSVGSMTESKTWEGAANSVTFSWETSGTRIKTVVITLAPTTVPVTITTAEYATFSSAYALDFSETGITVYTAEDKATSVALNEVTTGQVPANTPVVLYKKDADGTAINVPVIASAASIDGTNDLQISTADETNDNSDSNTNMYVLAKKDSGVGFYKWAGGTLSAGKIYLQGKDSYGAREFLGFGDGETTAINDVRSKMAEVNGDIFDLQGRKVAQPQKGLYIVNGRKVVIK